MTGKPVLLGALGLLLWGVLGGLASQPGRAQSIRSAPDGTGTQVERQGDRYRITEGQTSGDRTNLFHSFEQFGLTADEIAVFQSRAEIRNILGRVVGGDPSTIDGLLRVIGGNANLFLINPAGILFGENARLDLPGSFTATTATGIGFASGEFNAVGPNSYRNLVGNPTNFAFAVEQPGAIANLGTLRVTEGDLTLLGGTVVNTGTLAAPNGTLVLAAVPGVRQVRLTQAGSLLSLEFERIRATEFALRPVALPELLTGGTVTPASGIRVAADGTVRLVGGTTVATGDVAIAPGLGATSLRSRSGLLAATGDLQIREATVQATGSLSLLAGDTVRLRDSSRNPLRAIARDNVLIQGNQAVDIFALNNSESGLFSGGDLTLRSPNAVGADAHFYSGGNFRIEQLDGSLGNLFSPYDPVIRSLGNVSFNSYTGASLHIIAAGSVTIPGAIIINAPDAASGLAETVTLSNGTQLDINGVLRPTLDIRAGVAPSAVGLPGLQGVPPAGLAQSPTPTSANITLGSVTADAPNLLVYLSTQYNPNFTLPGGTIRITDPAGISVDAFVGQGGQIVIDSRRSVFSAGPLDAATLDRQSGDILVLAARGNITASTVQTFGATAGTIRLTSRFGSIRIAGDVDADASNGNGGAIRLQATGTIGVGGDLLTSASGGDGGLINVFANQGIQLGDLDTVGEQVGTAGGQAGLIVLNSPSGSIRTGAIDTFGIGGQGGSVGVQALGDIVVGDVNTSADSEGGDLTIISQLGSIAFGSVDTEGAIASGNVALRAPGFFGSDISGGSIQASTLNGSGGFVLGEAGRTLLLGDITVSGFQQGGAIALTANRIQTGTLDASAPNGVGGTLGLSSRFATVDDTIVTADLFTNGALQGGDIQLRASTVSTGRLVTQSSLGDGGAVSIRSNDLIEVEQVDTRGGELGRGGAVTVVSLGLLRFTDVNSETNASINTSGGLGGGDISLIHGVSRFFEQPFDVGDARINGTAGAITSGDETIAPFQSFPDDYRQGNIEILTRRNRSTDPPLADGENDPMIDLDQDPFDVEDIEDEEDDEIGDVVIDLDASDTFGDTSYRDLEDLFSSDFTTYFGDSGVAIQSLNNARAALTDVEQQTGIRPALVYIRFAPTNTQIETAQDELELVLITATGDPIRKRIVGVTRSQITRLATEFRGQVTNPRNTRNTRYLAPAQQLYQWLIAPLASALEAEDIENLAFVLDEGLRSLPMAALHDGDRFLIERYSVGLMPSLSLVDTRYRDIRSNQVLAMGASEFSDQVPLPAVPIELREITTGRWQGDVFLNQDFTAQNLTTQRQQTPYGIVHLATHGEFSPGDLSNSYIQFWDQRLQLGQLRQLNLNDPPVNLLVLSACRMALGDAEAELGFAGFALQSGVQTALASLWYVSDSGTLALMTEFYRQLRSAPIKSEALRQAQISMIQGDVQWVDGTLTSRGVTPIVLPEDLAKGVAPNLTHPYYWSAFTMIGNPW